MGLWLLGLRCTCQLLSVEGPEQVLRQLEPRSLCCKLNDFGMLLRRVMFYIRKSYHGKVQPFSVGQTDGRV